MGSPAELALNSRSFVASSSSMFKAISLVGDQLERMSKQEDYIKVLEEERKKIEGFKRELPFCMQLLTDAIEACKAQMADCEQPSPYRPFENARTSNAQPVLEEFIPIRKTSEASEEKGRENRDLKRAKLENGDKPNWMVSAQLWNPHPEPQDKREKGEKPVETFPKDRESQSQKPLPSNTGLFSDSKQRVGGGAFHPFSKGRQVIAPVPVRKVEKLLPDLALSSPTSAQETESSLEGTETTCLNAASTGRIRSKESKEPPCVPAKENPLVPIANGANTSSTSSTVTINPSQSQTQRKSRRCWSPELHRRFLNALQQLGGPQVATPKQIRELMKVDGLTNDEVKSHLQKYRLHTRRSSPAPQNANPQPPQVLVLGGFWVQPNPEYAGVPLPAAPTSPSQSQYCQPSISQEYYCQTNQPSKMQLHQPFYCEQPPTASHSQNSPEGPLHCNGQSSGARETSADAGREESVGDGNSDSTSWKADESSDTDDMRNMQRDVPLKKKT
eukprot:TRINITY_DN9940_c0_g1_i3.p1 TRINITY_DN9940_c0_g1~~TRINITY_DN9940_c0_g1_i3.p1  ORF type:complete len:502 (+),score=124.27 TRINITY_DN9940_c0_g1_i3:236-1741(+)